MNICSVVGARPQFIKLAPLVKKISESAFGSSIDHRIVHTGQHYDYKMDRIFFEQLGIPSPSVNLEVGPGTHAVQTGEMMRRLEACFQSEKPDLVIVFGDTNSTLAGALVSAKLHLPIAHVEAGLRSFNRNMPEEINRILTDHCSDLLFTPTRTALDNLKKEGFSSVYNHIDSFLAQEDNDKPGGCQGGKDRFPLAVNVGDIMLDAILMMKDIAEKESTVLSTLHLKSGGYYLATVHRPENTDDPIRMQAILKAFSLIAKKIPLVLPLHPRTRKIWEKQIKFSQLGDNVLVTDPVGYLDMLKLEKNARAILTDSGGIQKEAFFLKVPCLTLRDETEWPETVKAGYNQLVGADTDLIFAKAQDIAVPKTSKSPEFPFGEGNCAGQILDVLATIFKDFSTGSKYPDR
ncbi:MAG: UDP-N-acetyl glucosamine 2-epimerase [Acidobacteriota bacterium]